MKANPSMCPVKDYLFIYDVMVYKFIYITSMLKNLHSPEMVGKEHLKHGKFAPQCIPVNVYS